MCACVRVCVHVQLQVHVRDLELHHTGEEGWSAVYVYMYVCVSVCVCVHTCSCKFTCGTSSYIIHMMRSE